MAITIGGRHTRASYVNIFQPKAGKNGDLKYTLTLLIPKADTVTLNTICAEIERAKQEGAQKVFNGAVPPMCRTTLYDGDGLQPQGEPFGEECRGHMVLRTSSTLRPTIVGEDMQEIINPADVYSGCYVRVNINFFAYNNEGGKGIACGLNAVQKIRDGEPLTGRVSAEEAFGGSNAYTETADTYGMAQNYQPAVPQYTPQYMPQQVPPAYTQPGQAYGYPQQGQQIDPITGRPLLNGGVMGIV